MTPKQFGIELGVAAATIALVFVSLLNLIVDPYGEYKLLTDYSFRSSGTTAFSLLRQLDDGPFELMFGTSSSANFDAPSLDNAPLLNFSMALSGDPERIYSRLRMLSKPRIQNIQRIYFAIERDSLHCIPVFNSDRDFADPVQFALMTLENIGRYKLVSAADRLMKEITGLATAKINSVGTYEHLRRKEFQAIQYPDGVVFGTGACQATYLRAIDHFAKRNNIPIVFFRTVLHKDILKASDYSSLLAHYTQITSNVRKFYSLIWLDGVSDSTEYFRDPVHPHYETTVYQGSILKSEGLQQYRVRSDEVQAHVMEVARRARQ